MGTVLSSTVVIVSGSISTNTLRDTQWLTLGITVSSLLSGTCTTSTATVLWTRTILNAAVRNTVIEGKGDWNEATFKKNQEVMANLWNEIAELADFNKDGEVDAKEFADAVKKNCMNKPFAEMPEAFKTFISGAFKSIDVDGDGSVGLTEFRVDCVNRMAYKSIADLDAAYNKLLNDEDK